jgi:transposase
MTSDIMIHFINKYIKGKYKNNLIIMDNGGTHKSKNIKECVSESNNTLLYSVPYLPKTNAIESWFNQLKYYFRLSNNGAITYNELKEKVKISINMIPKQSYSNYILYSYKNKDIRTYEPKKSTIRRKLKEYID